MKKALLIILSLIIITPTAFGASNKKMIPNTSDGENLLPNIFIYAMPDDDSKEFDENLTEYVDPNNKNDSQDDDNAITLEDNDDNNITLGATTLKGYAQFVEDSSAVHLRDDNGNYALNIKTPQRINGTKGLDLAQNNKPLERHMDSEYKIAPNNFKASSTAGDFTFGATYTNSVDSIAMLETETGLFTKYEKNRFALSSSFTKSLNTTYAGDYNTISFTPELKLCNYLSLKSNLSADITRNRRSTKLAFSFSPFKDRDRMRLEVGAKQTVYLDNDFTKTEFSFSTIFKL